MTIAILWDMIKYKGTYSMYREYRFAPVKTLI